LSSFISECGFGGIRPSAAIRRLVPVKSSEDLVMPSVRFNGRVLPTALNMTIRKHPTLKVRDVDADYDMLFDVTIEDGHIIIDCTVENYEASKHYSPLYTRAFDIANASVNLAAFGMGVGATVILDSSIEEDGIGKILVFRDRELERLCTAFSPDKDSFDNVLEQVFQDLRLSRAIKDLLEGVAVPHVIPENCARAIETIRVMLVPKGTDRKRSWPIMQEHLRISEAYLRSITDYGIGPRHGDYQYVPGTQTRVIATRSWIIMDRFLEYKKRGSQPLPSAEFPLLAP
jgi:hypothetical protein